MEIDILHRTQYHQRTKPCHAVDAVHEIIRIQDGRKNQITQYNGPPRITSESPYGNKCTTDAYKLKQQPHLLPQAHDIVYETYGSYDCQSGKNPSRLGRQMLHKIDGCRQPVDHASACQRRLVVRTAPVRHIHDSVFSGNAKINQLCSKKRHQYIDVFHDSSFSPAGDPAITN